MVKKNTETALVLATTAEVKTDTLSVFEIPADGVELVAQLGIDFKASVEQRTDMAAMHMNRSQLHELASGLLLSSVKAECAHGEFERLVAERGFEERRARRAMQYAKAIMSLPAAQRERLLEWPKNKVMALAGADLEVIDALLLDGGDIESLNVRGLREQIADLEAGLADVNVQRDTAEARVAGLEKKLAKGLPNREDEVPLAIADLRADIVASHKKAELGVLALRALGIDLVQLHTTDEAHDWADDTLRLAVAALAALKVQLEGVMKQYLDVLPGADTAPTERSYLTAQEVVETATRFNELIALDGHEKALREWERAKDRPQGKGRPKAKPEAPGAKS